MLFASVAGVADGDRADERTDAHALGRHRERGEQGQRVGNRRVRAAVVADVADGALHHVVGEPQRVELRRLDGGGDLHEVREEAV